MNFLFLFSTFNLPFYYSYFDFIIFTILTLFPLLIVVAFFTLAERKVMGSIQRRKGPNQTGFWGFLQPFADGLKLIIKEITIPIKTNNFLFIFSPALTLILSFIGWIIVPLDFYTVLFNLNNNILLFLVVSSLAVYGILLAGWSSNSKYALLGCLRCVSQMISYEVSISLIIIPIILFTSSLNINEIISIQNKTTCFFFPLFPLCSIFFFSILAETNRAPFDLPEAEAELVAGYNVEYSSISFAAFFLGEYSNILLMSMLFILFFGSDSSSHEIFDNFLFDYSNSIYTILIQNLFSSLKTIVICFFFIFIRANLPRFRFDQLMFIGWKIFLPVTLAFLFFYPGFLFSINSLNIIQLPRTNSSFNYIDLFSTRF